MAGCEGKEIQKIFPPMKGKNCLFAIKNADDEDGQQGREKGGVKKTPVPEEIICRDIQIAVADDVGIRKA